MASLRKFSLCHPSCFSVCLACWLSKEPVIQASSVEHQRSVLWKPAARISSSESLAHIEYLFMRAQWQLGRKAFSDSHPKSLPGVCPPGAGVLLGLCGAPQCHQSWWDFTTLLYCLIMGLCKMCFTSQAFAPLKWWKNKETCELRIRSTLFSHPASVV